MSRPHFIELLINTTVFTLEVVRMSQRIWGGKLSNVLGQLLTWMVFTAAILRGAQKVSKTAYVHLSLSLCDDAFFWHPTPSKFKLG